jgi:hypothetical protein
MNFNNTKTYVQSHSKLFLTLAALLLLLGAFAAGRYTVATKTITKTETVVQEKVVTQVQTQIQYVEKKVYVTAVKDNVVTKTDTIEHPDGTKETQTTTTDLSQTTTKDTDQASSTAVVTEKVAETEKVDTKSEKIVDSTKPQWILRADLGAGARFVGQLTPTMVVGLGADRRILGPVFMGVWVQTTLNLLAPQTPPYGLNGGISLSLEL